MLKVRITKSEAGFADFSAYEVSASRISASEISRKIPEKWLFAISSEFSDNLRRFYHATAVKGKSASEFEQRLSKIGHTFTKLLFGADWPVKTIFTADLADPAVFTIDKHYSHLPFEILSDGEHFLCDRRPVLRAIRSDRRPNSTRPFIGWYQRKKILLPVAAADNAEVLKSALAERNSLLNEFEKHRISVRIQSPQLPQLRLSTLLENMLSVDYLHFTGHSSDLEIPLSGGEALSPKDITGLNLQNLRLVFLNSCESALQINPQASESFASAFISAGVANFIGYSYPIPNNAAEIIGINFWRRLNQGDQPYIALFKARQIVKETTALSPYRFILQHFGDIELIAGKPTLSRYTVAAAMTTLLIGSSLIWRWNADRQPFMLEAQKNRNPAVESASRIMGQGQKDRIKRAKPQPSDQPEVTRFTGSATDAQRAEIKLLISKFGDIPYRDVNKPKDIYTEEDINTMGKLFYLIDKTADKRNFVCSQNLRNGKLPHGMKPIGRWQVLRNLLVFGCVQGGPADWDNYVLSRVSLRRKSDAPP